MYFHVCNWLPLLYSRNWHHNVKQLDFNVKKFKKNWQKKKVFELQIYVCLESYQFTKYVAFHLSKYMSLNSE